MTRLRLRWKRASGGGGGAQSGIQYGRTSGYNAGTTFDYIVSPTGNDTTGNGSLGNPYATISKALTVIGATTNKSIGLRAGTHYANNLSLAAAGTRVSAYNGETAIVSAGLKVTGWAQCTSGDSTLLGSGYANIYKTTISTSGWGHAAYNALLPIENGQILNLVQNRRDTTDLFEQSDDSAFWRYTLADGVTAGDHTIAVNSGTFRNVQTVTRKTTANTADTLTFANVTGLVAVNQGGTWNGTSFTGGTTYTSGADYKLTGNTVDWSLGGIEPAASSTYTVVYDHSGTATIAHPSIIGAYTNTQLVKMAVMLLADPNVPVVLKIASADASTGTITLVENDQLPDLSPSGGAYALLNNLKDLTSGQWGWVDNGDGTITLYWYPLNTAHVATGLDIAAYDRIFTVNANSCQIDGLTLQSWADDATGTAGIIINNVTGCTIKENLLRYYSHQQKGYGSIYGLGGDGYLIFNNDIQWGQNQYGFFLAKGVSATAQNNRVHNNKIYRTSQTGPRFYGQKLTAFYDNWIDSCGVAAHANKINWYNGSDQCVTLRNKWSNSGGYATMQEASRLLWLMNIIPMGPQSTDTARAFDDQTSAVQPPTDPSQNYFLKNLLMRAGANVPTGTAVAAQFIPDRTDASSPAGTYIWRQMWNVLGNVLDGASYNATYLTQTDYNTITYGSGTGTNDTTGTVAALFADASNENYQTLTGAALLTQDCSDLTTIINIYKGWFPDLDFDHDLNGNTVDWTHPGRGPYAKGKWPVAA